MQSEIVSLGATDRNGTLFHVTKQSYQIQRSTILLKYRASYTKKRVAKL